VIDKLKSLAFPALVLWLLILTLNSFLGFEMATPVLWSTGAIIIFAFATYVVKMKIFSYIFFRFIEAFLTLFAVATFTFLLLRVLPGGPFDQEKTLPPEVMENIAKKYNLDAPIYEQYYEYIKGVFTLDFGESYKYIGRPITEMLAESMPASIELGIYSLILAFLLGIPAGVWAASKHNQLSDRILMFFSISGIALPVFVVSPILILIFCYKLELLPAAMWSGTPYYILPVLALGTRPAATIARLTRCLKKFINTGTYLCRPSCCRLTFWLIYY